MPAYIISMALSVLFEVLKDKQQLARYRKALLKLREVLDGLELD